MPNLTGYRILDASGNPIDSSNPLAIKFPSDPITVTVASSVGINTITASVPILTNVATNTSSIPFDIRIRDASTATDFAEVCARKQAPTGKALQVQIGPGDVISNLPVILFYDHHQIHEGETWRWSVFVNSLASGNSKDIQLVVPNITIPGGTNPVALCPHFRFEVISDSYTNFYLYASPTLTNGTARTPINQERNGTYTPKLLIYEDPVVTSVGTQIFQGVTFVSKSSGGAADVSENEFVLKNNTTYLLRVTSGTAGAKVLIRMIWYEDLGV